MQLRVLPEVAVKDDLLKRVISKQLKINVDDIQHVNILKRSIDARNKITKINLVLDVYINELFNKNIEYNFHYKNVSKAKEVIIIGAGPAGLFAALKLIERGIKPIIFERGKNVRSRRRDLALLTKEHLVNEDSNYCFGEGGAGTFSDGKLYTRSKKRGDVNKILDVLVFHGANPEIKINAHPHIGTNKLPDIIQNIRNTIIEYGGEIHFNQRVIDIIIKNNNIIGIKLKNGNTVLAKKVILATGHSARDIYYLLHKKKIELEAKSFALGVRIEHKQDLIDQIQYKCANRGEYLPPASYSIVKQINGRGVYSFCMCPGGIIAPCATKPGEVVTNGWSPSKRDYHTANSGIVVQLDIKDFINYEEFGPLCGVEFQKDIERKACLMAGNSQKVPAQRMVDFLDNKLSSDIPKTSYIPGTESSLLSDLFPDFINTILKEGFKNFGTRMKGYITNDAILHAPESRTSSPIRIPRNKKTLEHCRITGLYPCGEGAGYAGGIISAAIDGEKCAEMCFKY